MQYVCHLHVPEPLGAVQDALHLGIKLRVVIWLDVEYKILIRKSQVARKGQVIRPTPAEHTSGERRCMRLAWIGQLLSGASTGLSQLQYKWQAVHSATTH